VFDFRYHALSLIAVLVALVLGLLLGVAIGDKGLVSSAENKIKESLRADVRAEQKKVASLDDQLTAKEKFEQEVYPLLVDGQLQDRKIGVVFLGDASDEINNEVENALADSGGKKVGAVQIREPLAADDLGSRATGTRYETLATGDDQMWEDFGTRMGVQLTDSRGGKLLNRERRSLFSAVAGSTGPYDGVVIARNVPNDIKGDDLHRLNAFESGLMKGLTSRNVPVVGVEHVDADPTQVPWYRDHGVSTVDNLDQTAGQAALVFLLAGNTDGAFGVHQPRLLPDVVGGVPG
jgi:Copper transport outer membrane protein, MctB